jgi:proline racemase
MEITRAVAVIDTHTGGEPTRLIIGGAPLLRGKTMGEKWIDFVTHHDDFRVMVMCEPRGHGDMFGALLVPPCSEAAHYGVIFMDSSGSISMCGHGSIGLGRTLVDLGMIPKQEPFTEVVLDTPAGLVTLRVAVTNGVVGDVTLKNVPAFVFARDVEVTVPSWPKPIHLDIAFGGNFFAIVPADQFAFEIVPEEVPKMIPLGLEIRDAVNRTMEVRHPVETHIHKVELTEFSLEKSGEMTRNCVVFASGSVDRSPCGTGTCAKMALLAAKGKLRPGEEFLHKSVTGSVFLGSYEPGPDVAGFSSVVPTLRGRSFVTGMNFLLRQKEDEVGNGFLLPK